MDNVFLCISYSIVLGQVVFEIRFEHAIVDRVRESQQIRFGNVEAANRCSNTFCARSIT